MKSTLGRIIGHSKTVYITSALTLILLGIVLTSATLLPETEIAGSPHTVIILAALFFSWLSWLSHVLTSRRAMRNLGKQVRHDVQRIAAYSEDNLEKVIAKSRELKSEMKEANHEIMSNISTQQENHVEEYNKQAYNVLITLQDLRIAVLDDNDRGTIYE